MLSRCDQLTACQLDLSVQQCSQATSCQLDLSFAEGFDCKKALSPASSADCRLDLGT